MKALYRNAACLSLLIATMMTPLMAASPSPSPTTEPLVESSNLVYKGAFQLPQIACHVPTYACFAYGGTAITYDTADNSLYIVGHPYTDLTAEVSVPTAVINPNISDLPTATLLQNFSDSLEGKRNSVNPTDPNPHYIGGQLVYNGKLIISVYSYYDAAGTQTTSHFSRPLNLSTTGQVSGPFRVGTQYPGFVNGYMTVIPPEWQSLLGGPALTGNCCLAIAGIQSNGPSVSVFNPADLGNETSVPSTMLVGYPHQTPLSAGWGTQSNLYNGTTSITGIVFPAGTRSVLFFGRQGTGPFCYGPGTSNKSLAGTTESNGDTWCYDPAASAKGTHAYPYVDQVWAYDADDLLKVKSGIEQPYQVKPYAVWTLKFPYQSPDNMNDIEGVAYDAQSDEIFISQRCPNNICNPVIQVFKVDLQSKTRPSAPTDVTVQ